MSLFGNIFGKKAILKDADLSVLEVDLHSHLIPGIDDGVKTIEESVTVIKALHQLGYKKLITTPHIMGDYYKNSGETILPGLEKVREALAKESVPVEIEAAAEYYVDDLFLDKLVRNELLTFSGNKVLIELPFFNEPTNFFKVVFELTVAGYKPVLAHVERYTFWHRDMESYEKLRDREVLLQMNITSLLEEDSTSIKRIAEKLISNNYIDILGSDVHNMKHIEKIHKALPNRSLEQLVSSGRLINKSL